MASAPAVPYDRAMRTMRRALVVIFFAALLAAPGQAFGLTVAPPGHVGH